MDGIVITEMRTAAASAVATKVRRETHLNLYRFVSCFKVSINKLDLELELELWLH